jgi:hypothetical protein
MCSPLLPHPPSQGGQESRNNLLFLLLSLHAYEVICAFSSFPLLTKVITFLSMQK